jgi:hypothetical protein
MIKVYHVHGTRHQAVIFAETPDQAVVEAIERGLVDDWEEPEAIEAPLPPGYRILYNPTFIPPQQAELRSHWTSLLPMHLMSSPDPGSRSTRPGGTTLSWTRTLLRSRGRLPAAPLPRIP